MNRIALVLSVAALALAGCNRNNEDTELKENLRAGQTELKLVQTREVARIGKDYHLEDYILRVDIRSDAPSTIQKYVEGMEDHGWRELQKGSISPTNPSVHCAGTIGRYEIVTCFSDVIGTAGMIDARGTITSRWQLDTFLETHRMVKATRLQKEAKG